MRRWSLRHHLEDIPIYFIVISILIRGTLNPVPPNSLDLQNHFSSGEDSAV